MLRPYGDAEAFTARWYSFARTIDAKVTSAGLSLEGREIPRLEFGGEGPSVLLTALIHGTEVIGSLALLRALERMPRALRERHQFVVLPIVNPDALHENLKQLSRGRLAYRRCNTRGVDLNRNFPRVGVKRSFHPFSGSRCRHSPHYVGEHPLSEPESTAVATVARALRPAVALGFHSFGNLLLYPWAHKRERNPREAEYSARGRAFVRALRGERYRVGQAINLYPTVGDLDDWLDHELSTLAFTVEVSSLDRRLLDPRRAINPFDWMNPSSDAAIERTVEAVAPALSAMLSNS